MQHRIFDYESSEQLLHDRQIAGLQLPFARDILTGGGMKRERCCTTCNGCMAWIKKTGKAIRCVKAETGGRTKERDAK